MVMVTNLRKSDLHAIPGRVSPSLKPHAARSVNFWIGDGISAWCTFHGMKLPEADLPSELALNARDRCNSIRTMAGFVKNRAIPKSIRNPPLARYGAMAVLSCAIPLVLIAQWKPFKVPTEMMEQGNSRAPRLDAQDRRILLTTTQADMQREPQPGGVAQMANSLSLADFVMGEISLRPGETALALKAEDRQEKAYERNLCTHGNCSILLYRQKKHKFRLIFKGDGFALGVLNSADTTQLRDGVGDRLNDLVLARSFGGGLVELQRYSWIGSRYHRSSCELLAPRDPDSMSAHWWQQPGQAISQPCNQPVGP